MEQVDYRGMWEYEHQRTKECTDCGSLYDARSPRCPCWHVKQADVELAQERARADAAEQRAETLRGLLARLKRAMRVADYYMLDAAMIDEIDAALSAAPGGAEKGETR